MGNIFQMQADLCDLKAPFLQEVLFSSVIFTFPLSKVVDGANNATALYPVSLLHLCWGVEHTAPMLKGGG